MNLVVYGLALAGAGLVAGAALGSRRRDRAGGTGRRTAGHWRAGHPDAAARVVGQDGAVASAGAGELGSWYSGGSAAGRFSGLSTAIGVAVAAAFVAIFCLLLDDVVGWERVTTRDGQAASWVAERRAGWLTSSMRAVTELGTFRLLAGLLLVLAAYLAIHGRRPDAAVLVLVASAGTWLLANALKLMVARGRPEVGQMLIHADGYAFPSGHAAQGVATYGALAYLAAERAARRRRRLLAWTAALLIAGLIGFSRLYLGVHWLTDVLAGWALGSAMLALLITTASAYRRERRAALYPGGPARPLAPGPAGDTVPDPAADAAIPVSERDTVRLW